MKMRSVFSRSMLYMTNLCMVVFRLLGYTRTQPQSIPGCAFAFDNLIMKFYMTLMDVYGIRFEFMFGEMYIVQNDLY